MKKLLAIGLCVVICCGLCACGNNSTKKEENVTSTNQQKTEMSDSSITKTDSSTQQNQPQARSEYVVLSFNAVEGAVIYNQTFDSHGYPDCCYFHKKCEACGDVSNSNGSATGNLTTSYHCIKCGNNQHVEITANCDWVTVYD